jgi:Holliday junction resolvase RusA-like endonuclease
MATMRFILPFEPLAAPRPRVRCVARGKGISYTDPRYRSWLKAVGDHLDSLPAFAKFLKPEELTVSVLMCAVRPATTKLPAPKWDVDNAAKAVLDVLNGRAYEDDAQIVELHALKKWSESPRSPGFIQVSIGQYGGI